MPEASDVVEPTSTPLSYMTTVVFGATVPVKTRPGDGKTMPNPVMLSLFEEPVSEAVARSGAVDGALADPLNVAVFGVPRQLFARSVSGVVAVGVHVPPPWFPVTVNEFEDPKAPGDSVRRTFVASACRVAAVTVCAVAEVEMVYIAAFCARARSICSLNESSTVVGFINVARYSVGAATLPPVPKKVALDADMRFVPVLMSSIFEAVSVYEEVVCPVTLSVQLEPEQLTTPTVSDGENE